jgi:hypothetical protein
MRIGCRGWRRGRAAGGIHRARIFSRQFFRDNFSGGVQIAVLMKAHMKRILAGLTVLVIAALIWLPCLHLLFTRPVSAFRPDQGLSPKARQLAARHLQLWTDPALREAELGKMRASNAEWDFMGRSFLVWSLANMALRDPGSKALYLQTMDRIIDETLRLEKQEGMYFFLMAYAKERHYLVQPAHSLFLDGEIALMLAARRAVEEKIEYKPLLAERVDAIVERLQKSPRRLLESYPDECWMFDHCVALDAIKLTDYLDGRGCEAGHLSGGGLRSVVSGVRPSGPHPGPRRSDSDGRTASAPENNVRGTGWDCQNLLMTPDRQIRPADASYN